MTNTTKASDDGKADGGLAAAATTLAMVVAMIASGTLIENDTANDIATRTAGSWIGLFLTSGGLTGGALALIFGSNRKTYGYGTLLLIAGGVLLAIAAN